jgi:hypothetical protein
MNGKYAHAILTETEMAELTEDMGWHKPGDYMRLGGYLPDMKVESHLFHLVVNTTTQYGWIRWKDMPEWLHRKLYAYYIDVETGEEIR